MCTYGQLIYIARYEIMGFTERTPLFFSKSENML